ncbi:MAG: GNAT family N-acetyltransferase [Beijerinckiaceae bacterium]|nr:GNAT family N-acetyltransferase [Beijerinckiaceae bacterium]
MGLQEQPMSGHVRKLFPADLPEFRAHLLRLDPESRRARFAMIATDAFIANYAETAFALDTILFGYFEAGEMRGAAELRMLSGQPARMAEAAFSVEPDCRHRGIGSTLMEQLIVAARNRGMRKLYMSCLGWNRPMQALARRFSAELVFETEDVLGILEAPAATPGSLMQEAWSDAGSFATAILDLQQRWWKRYAFLRPRSP